MANSVMDESAVDKAGWIWLSEDNDDFEELPVKVLLAEHSPGTVFWLTWDDHLEVSKSVDRNPESLSATTIFPDSVWNLEDSDSLLLVETTGKLGGTGQSRTVEYRVVAAHSPHDIYGPKGTPLRDLLETLEGKGRMKIIDKMPPVTSNEEWERTKAFEKAAKQAVIAADEDKWGFKDSIWTALPGSCQHGQEYVALIARHLIGTTPEWTQEAYDCLTHRFRVATGRGVHPDD
ncbi:hypothetical protein [Mycobacteroides abscessus]